MKKQIALVLVFALLLPLFAGCQSVLAAQHTPTPESAPATEPSSITRDEALEIALSDAGLTRQEIYDLEVEPDRDKGDLHYDVDFEKDGKDYDYEIHAETGEILKKEEPVTTPVTPTPTTPTPTKPADTETAKRLTKEEALNIALTHAGLTKEQIRDPDVELDKERGVVHYEVDFEAGAYEYEYEIHAETGEILKSEKERD